VLSSTSPNRCRRSLTRRVYLARPFPLHGRPSRVRFLAERRRGNTLLPTRRGRATLRRKLFELIIEPLVPLTLFRKVPARPELGLYAEVLFDAVRLVRGEGVVVSNQADVRAASYWIRNGNIGVVTFDACCAWLGWDAEHTREAIFSTALAA
jgi:hypothetical protein